MHLLEKDADVMGVWVDVLALSLPGATNAQRGEFGESLIHSKVAL
jgi:hypothetical protein